MVLHWICVISLLGVVVSGDDSCPTPADISPCTCDGEGVNCMGALTLEQIKKTFQAKFKDGGVPSVWIQGTPVTSLPANLFGNVKSQQFFIEMNSITTVDLLAFTASRTTLRTLRLYGNKIKDFYLRDLIMFKNLTTLDLRRNQIEIIPENAFNSESLQVLDLSDNNIRHIESNAFGYLPRLRNLDMSSNVVGAIGPRSFMFISHSPDLQINIAANKLFYVDEDGFLNSNPRTVLFAHNNLKYLPKEPFAELVTKVAQKGGHVDVTDNPFSCKGCDFSWLVANKDILADKLLGFTCEDQRRLIDLTASNIECHK